MISCLPNQDYAYSVSDVILMCFFHPASSSLDLPRVFHETYPQAAMPELSSNLGKKQWPYAHIDENVVSNHVSSVNGGNMISESLLHPRWDLQLMDLSQELVKFH